MSNSYLCEVCANKRWLIDFGDLMRCMCRKRGEVPKLVLGDGMEPREACVDYEEDDDDADDR